MPISSALGSSALLPAGLGHRNKIINGDMRIAQRGTATITGSVGAQYPVDRWVVYNGTGTVTFAQSSIAPAGFSNSINATVTATGPYLTSKSTEIRQSIEGFNCQDLAWGTASAKPIMVSFWVRSSVVGAYNVAIQNSGQSRTYVTSFSILVANTWEYKTIQITGDTTGTWLVDNGVGLYLRFQLGMGSIFDTTENTWTSGLAGATASAIDFAANSGATFYLTGVQLEQNYQPTPFEQRPYGTELALCQRYYYRITNSSTGDVVGSASIGTGGAAFAFIQFPVTMRTRVTALEQSTYADFNWFKANDGTQNSLGLITFVRGSVNNATIYPYTSSAGAGQVGYLIGVTVGGYLGFSAEL